MNIKLQIKDYKLIKDLQVELESSNVYLVSGDNRTGKSTFLEAFKSLVKAKNDVKLPANIDASEASVIGIIENKDGEVYSVSMEADNDGNTKFVMVNPKGLKSKSVTAIRDVFGYQDFDADEFISWGNNAEGRRKQADILLQCFPRVLVDKYRELEEQEQIAYDNRTPILSDYSHYTKRLKEVELIPEHKKLIEEDLENVEKAIKETLDKNDKYLEEKYAHEKIEDKKISWKREFDNKINSYKDQITDIEAQILVLQQKKLMYENQIKETTTSYNKAVNELPETKAPEEINLEAVEKAKQMSDYIANAKIKYKEWEDVNIKFKEVEQQKKDYDRKIKDIRDDKANILQSSKIFDNVSIEEDGLYISDDNGTFPFNDKQICTSTQIMLATKILLKLNEKFPIVCIGRGESLGNKNIANLVELAKETNSIIITEKVISDESLKVEAIVNE